MTPTPSHPSAAQHTAGCTVHCHRQHQPQPSYGSLAAPEQPELQDQEQPSLMGHTQSPQLTKTPFWG